MRKAIVQLLCALAVVSGVVFGGASSASASESGVAFGGYIIWGRVSPSFSDFRGETIQGEHILATCKRWGADSQWWYWTSFSGGSLTGHIPAVATNIRHFHLDRCG